MMRKLYSPCFLFKFFSNLPFENSRARTRRKYAEGERQRGRERERERGRERQREKGKTETSTVLNTINDFADIFHVLNTQLTALKIICYDLFQNVEEHLVWKIIKFRILESIHPAAITFVGRPEMLVSMEVCPGALSDRRTYILTWAERSR